MNMQLTKLLARYDTVGTANSNESSDMSNAESSINSAQSSGETAINSFDPTTVTGAEKSGLGSSGLGGLLGGETSNYVGNYSAAIPGIQKLANTMYNVDPLATEANALQNRATNAVPDAYKGAAGYDIDSTDINNGIASKMAYLTPQVNAATNNFNTASGLAQQFVTNELQPYQQEGTLLGEQEAAQATGWNQEDNNQLQGLMQKMESGVTLSTAEMDTAQKLAATEEAYNSALATTALTNQYKTDSNGNLINTFAGTAINPSILTAKGYGTGVKGTASFK